MARYSQPSLFRAFALAALASFAVGCATINDLAPPVTADSLSVAQGMGFDPESIELGRTLYITACVKCHSPEAVTKYSSERWDEIIPRMAEQTELNDSDTEALTAYIRTTLELQDSP
jgi:mono/diheme cytochrome c family protein